AHVLRYWEQEFTQLKPVKRGGNRRYYQHHEVLLVRRIRQLLYEEGFTISGARGRLNNFIGQRVEDSQPQLLQPYASSSELRREIREILALLG
ncbi:MAG: MerR family transcriptional regulator, partial [Candidatus Nitrotoga sp.]